MESTIEEQKTQWIQKHAEMALDFWHAHEYGRLVSDEYITKLEKDLSEQYEDPIKREFVEMLWIK